MVPDGRHQSFGEWCWDRAIYSAVNLDAFRGARRRNRHRCRDNRSTCFSSKQVLFDHFEGGLLDGSYAC